MTFDVYFGVPEMMELWLDINEKVDNGKANQDEIALLKKLTKVIGLLKKNPRHNSLHSHEIAILSQRYGMRVWQSYLENHKPAAGRIYWIYYPPGSITIRSFQIKRGVTGT